MTLIPILIYPDPRLRQVCEPVKEVTKEIKKHLEDMAETMYAAPGIGLAASQVGIMKRLIVVDVGDDEESGRTSRLYKLVNPEIEVSAGTTDTDEGCLSLPDIRETVTRPLSVIVNALDESGKPVRIEAEGLLAVCLQHEIDHLNGVLFIDHLSRIRRELIRSKLKRLSTGSK